ncbi:MAG: hypothetical protein C0467_25400 [Planctomycetaceae bacterium]|nr:hypothetical protein [Planctomycetaceae bacterium]
MSALIAMLAAILGPLIGEVLKNCAEKKAEEAAAKLPPIETFDSEDSARDALFDQMIEDTVLPRRKRILRRFKDKAAVAGITSAGATTPLGVEDQAYLRGLAEAEVE